MSKTRNKEVSNRKSKGRRLQNTIRDLFKEAFILSDDDIRCAIGYEKGCDIKLSERAQKIVCLSLECKNQMNLSLWAVLKQAKDNIVGETCPALVFHRPIQGNSDIWITVPIEHYLDIRRRLFMLEDYCEDK